MRPTSLTPNKCVTWPYTRYMADYRSDAIANLEALDRAAQRCEAQLASARAAYRVGLAQLRSGTNVADALTVSQASVVRGEMTAAIDALECARRASRVLALPR